MPRGPRLLVLSAIALAAAGCGDATVAPSSTTTSAPATTTTTPAAAPSTTTTPATTTTTAPSSYDDVDLATAVGLIEADGEAVIEAWFRHFSAWGADRTDVSAVPAVGAARRFAELWGLNLAIAEVEAAAFDLPYDPDEPDTYWDATEVRTPLDPATTIDLGDGRFQVPVGSWESWDFYLQGLYVSNPVFVVDDGVLRLEDAAISSGHRRMYRLSSWVDFHDGFVSVDTDDPDLDARVVASSLTGIREATGRVQLYVEVTNRGPEAITEPERAGFLLKGSPYAAGLEDRRWEELEVFGEENSPDRDWSVATGFVVEPGETALVRVRFTANPQLATVYEGSYVYTGWARFRIGEWTSDERDARECPVVRSLDAVEPGTCLGSEALIGPEYF